MELSSELKQLSESLGRAVFNAQDWEDALNSAIDIIGAQGAILVPTDPQFRGMWMSCSTRLKSTLPEYLAGNWHLKDPREDITKLMVSNGIASDQEIFSNRKSRYETPFYKEFLCKHNFGNLLARRILTPNGQWGLMAHYANEYPKFSKKDYDNIKTIGKMFEKAASEAEVNVYQKISDFVHFFKGSDSDTYIFDSNGTEYSNISNGGVIRSKRSLNDFLPPEMKEKLNADILEVCSSEPSLSLSKAYQFKMNGKNYNLLIIQIQPAYRHFFMPFKVCAIRTLIDDNSALKQSRLRDDYQLSDSEISTTELLHAGNTPAVIAELLSVKVSTIRQRLKTIYNKTNVKGQVELIALYSNI